jgi:hypothetical protein
VIADNRWRRSWATTLYDSIIYCHGVPCELQSDGHKTFEGPSMRQLYARFPIDHHVIVSYHPRSNDVAERRTKDVMHALRAYVGHRLHHVGRFRDDSAVACKHQF